MYHPVENPYVAVLGKGIGVAHHQRTWWGRAQHKMGLEVMHTPPIEIMARKE